MELKDKRYKRLSEGSPVEIIETILNSIDNYLNRELSRAASAECWDLVLVGVHSVCAIIGEGLFGGTAHMAYKRFLSEFVDQTVTGHDYSAISDEIYGWRNVLSHRWLSHKAYEFGFDTVQEEGWRRVDGVILLNPKQYFAAFESAFKAGGPIWEWQKLLTNSEQDEAKERLLKNYLRD